MEDDDACILLTGRNNEGKSTILSACRLLNAATKVIGRKKQEFKIDGDFYWKLLQQDTERLQVGRMIHNYSDSIAEISALFSGGLRIRIYLDPGLDVIYADYEGQAPPDVERIFGIVPPLGTLAENEDLIGNLPYLRASMDTTLAPRHLRNHLAQILTKEQGDLVREIVNKTWPDVELLHDEIDAEQGKIFCFYKEGRTPREICWSGQGLQVWLQIITHLVRLSDTSILILDEPEIFLHPERQNDLLRILREYYSGSIIIATHSVELMNNVGVSHIVNVRKRDDRPQIKSTEDRAYLNLVRSQIGSNFNLVASQFEECDVLIFTEDTEDFNILTKLAHATGVKGKAFNIPLHGFMQHKACIPYVEAYELLIGKKIRYTLLLDRDYYPETYLQEIQSDLGKRGIRVIYTPGKEIENVFLAPEVLKKLFSEEVHEGMNAFLDDVYTELRISSVGSFLKLHQEFSRPKVDQKETTTKYLPVFEKCWNNQKTRYTIVEGKKALKSVRAFYHRTTKDNLPQSLLVKTLIDVDGKNIKNFVDEIFHNRKASVQRLRY